MHTTVFLSQPCKRLIQGFTSNHNLERFLSQWYHHNWTLMKLIIYGQESPSFRRGQTWTSWTWNDDKKKKRNPHSSSHSFQRLIILSAWVLSKIDEFLFLSHWSKSNSFPNGWMLYPIKTPCNVSTLFGLLNHISKVFREDLFWEKLYSDRNNKLKMGL